MWMLHWWCLFNICLFVHICYKLFDERPWYHVLGLLVVSLGPDGYAERQQRASFGIQGQLPSTFQYDNTDDGPTSVNVNYRDTHGNTTGLSYGLPRLLMMKFHVCQGDKILQAYMFDSSMYVATTSALTWCIVVDLVLFLSTSLLRQLPETYSMLHARFRILEAGVPEDLWRWFCGSPSVCVSPIPHEVPDEELSPVGISILTVWSFSLWMHADSKRKVHMIMVFGIRIVTAVKIWMLHNASNMLRFRLLQHYYTWRISDMHLEWWWVAVGNKTLCVAPATQVNSGYLDIFGVFSGCVFARPQQTRRIRHQ